MLLAMARLLTCTLAAFVLFAVGGLSAQVLQFPKVELEYDETADFSSFRTFRWKATQERAPNATVHSSVSWHVDRGLEKKGLKKLAEGTPDLYVQYDTESKRSLKGTASQTAAPSTVGGLSNSIDFHKETQGRLELELYRASDGARVWKAALPWGVVDPKKIDDDVENAVNLVLGKYPPPAGRR
jgi:hypothetical protein